MSEFRAKKCLAGIAALSLAGLPGMCAAGSLLGPAVTFEVNALSYDLLGSPKNDVRILDVAEAIGAPTGQNLDLIAIGWDLRITSLDLSWLSEAGLRFADQADEPGDPFAVMIFPGLGNDFPDSRFFSSGGVISLEDLGYLPNSLDEGVIRLEFFESFDDDPGFADSIVRGSVTVVVGPLSPKGCSLADIAEPFQTMDLADIVAFVNAFVQQHQLADIAPPFDVHDLADITAFITLFNKGCI